ncbi:MAG TPA: DUF192 domain-containing protein [Patescibacteria group bacterium]|nr:DUF192 domain-containing protein [Patescibacteria group bacterium]
MKFLLTDFEKSKGLIGAKEIYPVFFTTRWGIHTFGVLFPIDVLILDNDNRVVKLTRELPPNRLFFWNPKYQNVVELPASEIKRKGIILGDYITVQSTSS